MSNKVTLTLTYDGQVDEGDLQAIAEQAVLAMSDVYDVRARLILDGSTLSGLPNESKAYTAKADFDDEGKKVVV